MYIENPRQKTLRTLPQKNPLEKITRIAPQKSSTLMLEEPEEIELIEEHSEDVFLHWQAPEFELYEKDRQWYLWVSAILAAIVAWAVYTNSPIMAITFILIGVVGYIYLQKDPRILDFMLTPDGIVAGKELYEFDNITSFWIFYDPEGEKIISLKTKSHLSPVVHIPIHDEDPAALRRFLLEFIPEEKQDPGLWEFFERLLKF